VGVHTIRERCTHLYTATIADEAGAAIPGGSLTSLTLTLYDKASGSIINGRNAQNVLNANGVAVDGAGQVAWTISEADSVHLAGNGRVETHVALFRWTYASGAKAGHAEVYLQVQDTPRVP
jgi:hypothetical protein